MTRLFIVTLTLCAAAPTALAQSGPNLDLSWNTTDTGGGVRSGAGLEVAGTIGQPDAGLLSGGSFELSGGFWPGVIGACYANCDGSTGTPVLNVNDFICFQGRFAASDPYADCDHSNSLNVNDFVCFQNRFAAGCP